MDRVSQAVKALVEEIQRMPEAPDPAETDRHASVSYTHLTLPTIRLV